MTGVQTCALPICSLVSSLGKCRAPQGCDTPSRAGDRFHLAEQTWSPRSWPLPGFQLTSFVPRILTSLNSFRPASFSLEVEESLELAVEVCLSVQISLSLNFLILCSPVAQTVESLPAMQETWVSPWVRNIPWSRKWHPTPVLLPGKSHGQRGLMGCSPWGR